MTPITGTVLDVSYITYHQTLTITAIPQYCLVTISHQTQHFLLATTHFGWLSSKVYTISEVKKHSGMNQLLPNMIGRIK